MNECVGFGVHGYGFEHEPKEFACAVCGTPFTSRCAKAKFCSEACREKAKADYRKSVRKARRDAPMRSNKIPQVECHCVCCGTRFFRRVPQRFCSNTCKGVFLSFTPQMRLEREEKVRRQAEMKARLAARDAEYARLFPEQAKRHYAEISVSNGAMVDAEINRRYG